MDCDRRGCHHPEEKPNAKPLAEEAVGQSAEKERFEENAAGESFAFSVSRLVFSDSGFGIQSSRVSHGAIREE
jgi:hypothetical protein